MGIHIENNSFDGLEPDISLVKGGPGLSAGGMGHWQSGGAWSPGEECFAPCASARDSGAQMGDLECGDVILSHNYMIS